MKTSSKRSNLAPSTYYSKNAGAPRQDLTKLSKCVWLLPGSWPYWLVEALANRSLVAALRLGLDMSREGPRESRRGLQVLPVTHTQHFERAGGAGFSK